MKPILILIATTLALAHAATAHAATLRGNGLVEGGQITLSHLFDGIGDRADAVVAPAPAPGRQAVYDAPALARLARRFGIDWFPASQSDRVVLTRASTVVRAEHAQAALADALADRIEDGRLDVSLDNRLMEVHLPAHAAPTVAVEALTYDAVLGRFSGTLLAPAEGGPDQVRIPVSGRAVAVTEIPVLTRRLRAGEAIGPDDVAWIDAHLSRGSEGIIRTEQELIGLAPKRSLPAHTPLRARDLRQPHLVKRGSLVVIVLESPTMMLTAQGRALQDGAQGDVVRVVNTSSNRTIEATVSAASQVVVRAPGTAAQF